MANIFLYVLLGLAAGAASGLLGIGGGVIVIPALMFLFGLTQHQAQGTTLAMMVPPIGLLAALVYYRQGYVNLTMALFLCAGFLVGGFFGARLATSISTDLLRRIFGVALLLIAIHLIVKK